MPETSCIYAIICEPTQEFYIGTTVDPFVRYIGHLRDMNGALRHRVREFGPDAFTMVVLKDGIPNDQRLDFEAKYIYENYFNVRLLNRTAPSPGRLLRFADSAIKRDGYGVLFEKIDNDLKSDNPRSCFKRRRKGESLADLWSTSARTAETSSTMWKR